MSHYQVYHYYLLQEKYTWKILAEKCQTLMMIVQPFSFFPIILGCSMSQLDEAISSMYILVGINKHEPV